jgi:type II secretory pathway pseudopilin PulG
MSPHRQHGFTYLGLIILVAVIGLVGAAGAKFGAILQRRAAEQALLDIGAQFSDALRSYADATPPGQPSQPPSLKELLKDPRFPVTRRHLRKLFVDPVTGKAEWGIVYIANQVGVVAVYSLSNAKPIKQGNFEERFPNLAGKAHLSDWRFSMASQGTLLSPLPPAISPATASTNAAQVASPPAAGTVSFGGTGANAPAAAPSSSSLASPSTSPALSPVATPDTPAPAPAE